MRKLSWAGVALGLIGLGGWWYLTAQADATVVTPATYTVTRGTVTQTVLAAGQLEASQLVSVGAQVSGRIETLAVALGQRVEAGALIAQIDSLDQQNDLARSRAEIMQIDARIVAQGANQRVAELVLQRQEALVARGGSTQEALDAARATVDVLKSDLMQLQAEKASADIAVSSAQLALDRTRITAPIAGTVVAIVTEQGQTVNANQSAPIIVKLAQLDKMVVKAEISEADVVRVRAGQPVSFTILGDPARTFNAVVRDIEPAPASIRTTDTIDSTQAVYYKGLFDVDNTDGQLRIGMTAEVAINLAEARDVLMLPSAALGQQGQDGGYTVTVHDPRTRTEDRRAITVGLNNNVSAEVTGGLQEGEFILASGAAAGLSSAAVAPRGRGGMMGF